MGENRHSSCLVALAGALALCAAFCAGVSFGGPGSAQAQSAPAAVDVALVLAVDVSRSMAVDELLIQRKGYAAAIADPAVLQAIGYGAHGRIAVSFLEWAGQGHSQLVLDWTVIETREDAEAVAAHLLAGRSLGASRTSISGAIRSASALFERLPFEAERRVIDISGDGPNNEGLPVVAARDAAVEQGIVINGLPLMTRGGAYSGFSIDGLDRYYQACVVGGPTSFVVPVWDWAEFPEAVRRKLVMEIGRVAPGPAPGTGSEPDPAAPYFADQGASGKRALPVQFRPAEPYDCLIGEKLWEQRRRNFDFDR